VRRPHGTIAVGATARDTLRRSDLLLPAESTYAQEWKMAGVAGETVTIDVASLAFDAYAFLFGPGFEADLPQDDDSGGNCNARLTVRLPKSGDYYVVVTSRDKFATGAFTLSVAPGPKQASLVRCNR
jgi:serine protease Do